MKNIIFYLVLPLLVSLSFGCSFVASSKSISNSISSPFKWSSGSSAGGGDAAYRQEIRNYTVAYTRSGGDVSAFRRGVGSLASNRGITDWESDDATVTAIGAGLRQSGMGEPEMEAFASELFPQSPGRSTAIEKGYASAR